MPPYTPKANTIDKGGPFEEGWNQMAPTLTIANYIGQVLLAIIGIILSVKPELFREVKWRLWKWIIIIAIFVIMFIGVVSTMVNDRQSKNMGDKLLNAENELKKIHSSISGILPGVDLVLKKYSRLNAQNDTATNKQICIQAMDLIKRIRKFAYERKERMDLLLDQRMNALRPALENKNQLECDRIWHQYNLIDDRQRNKDLYEFRSTVFGEAWYLKDELFKRMPSAPPPERFVFDGDLTGPDPEEEIAKYLEYLSRKLCP